MSLNDQISTIFRIIAYFSDITTSHHNGDLTWKISGKFRFMRRKDGEWKSRLWKLSRVSGNNLEADNKTKWLAAKVSSHALINLYMLQSHVWKTPRNGAAQVEARHLSNICRTEIAEADRIWIYEISDTEPLYCDWEYKLYLLTF